ncbi:hypothetical protein Y032_0079g1261 [Ancylostoma ceylanicum]|uniref:Uncharacterized protein n=2 Tax=Ancylostoma ceylanicum TaxID=53326 RepID=A0A016TU49_9BILA|nr:hypothetical protein Y032_0079g1261 [Ancylostoma ceylanicum]
MLSTVADVFFYVTLSGGVFANSATACLQLLEQTDFAPMRLYHKLRFFQYASDENLPHMKGATDEVNSHFSVVKVFSVLYTACNILQSALTSPGLYSTFIWYAMRYLPLKLSPDYDPVTLWKKREVLERYRLRTVKNWKDKTMRRCRGETTSYPWTAAHPFVPLYVPNPNLGGLAF